MTNSINRKLYSIEKKAEVALLSRSCGDKIRRKCREFII